MAQDLIRYDLLAQEALRGVVRTVLSDVARNGLPGEHHLYIAFRTTAPGVRISNRLRERYEEEMTVVLQHQFWDLEVTDTTFSVGLSFNGVPERLVVPFKAIKGFFDPSVQFGLQFEPMGEAAAAGEEPAEPATDETAPAGDAEAPALEEQTPEATDPAAPPAAGNEPGTAEVVSLDKFRKKS